MGYGTDTQVRGTVAWEDRRVNSARSPLPHGSEGGSRLAQSLDARYIVPIGDPATEKFTLQLTGEHERVADIDDRTVNFIPSFTHVRGPWFGEHYWQRVTYVEFLHTESEFVASGRTDTQSLLIPGISFALVPRNYLGEALFSRTLYAELRGSHSCARLGFRLPAGARARRARFRHSRRSGTCCCAATSAPPRCRSTSGLAPSQRFFAGGDRSVRGFGVNELSPVEQATDAGHQPARLRRRRQSQSTKRSAANTCSPAPWS